MALDVKEKFLLKLKEKLNDEYELISEYIDNETEIEVLHKECQNSYKVIPHSLLRKGNTGKCPYCKIIAKNMTEDQFLYKLKNLIKDGNDYELVSFKGFTQGFVLKHKRCGRTFETFGYPFVKRGYRCKYCSHRSYAYTTEEYVELIKTVDPEYSLISEYVKENTKIILLHHKCGKEWEVFPRNFVYNKNKCPHCKEIKSKKAYYIEQYLDLKQIDYEKEKIFENCKNKRNLPFDFYIKEINTIIEFDGEQHFYPMRDMGGKEKLMKTSLNDYIKNKFCNDNKIPLIRIHYKLTEIEIKEILDELINNKCLSATTIERHKLYFSNYLTNEYYLNINENYKFVNLVE